MASLNSSVRSILRNCLNLKSGESLLIVTEETLAELGELLWTNSKKITPKKSGTSLAHFSWLDFADHHRSDSVDIAHTGLAGAAALPHAGGSSHALGCRMDATDTASPASAASSGADRAGCVGSVGSHRSGLRPA